MRASVLLTVVCLSACAAYPTTRTFYEPDQADGKPENRASCGYMNTKDSIRRIVDGIEISISPAEENISTYGAGDLETFFGFSFRGADVRIDPSKIKVTDGSQAIFQGQVLEQSTRPTRRPNGTFTWTTLRLVYPAPAGRIERLTYVFEPGSVTFDGKPVPVSAFNFTRVTKSDVYYGSINC